MIRLNDKIDDLVLNIDDEEVNLYSLKHKYFVIYFYPKDSTSGCTMQAQKYAELHDEFTFLDAFIIGVSKDSVSSHKKFKKDENLTFDLASDESLELNKYFDVYQEKSMYGKKYMGTVRSSFILDSNYNVIKANYNVKPADDALSNLEFLKGL